MLDQLDILGALDLAMISVIMSFLFVNLFDTAGNLMGVATRAKLIDETGEVINLEKALKADNKNYYDEYFRLIYSEDLDKTFDDFKDLAHNITMQIAAMNPIYIDMESNPTILNDEQPSKDNSLLTQHAF